LCILCGQANCLNKEVTSRLLLGLLKSTRECKKISVHDLPDVVGLPTVTVKGAVELLGRRGLLSCEGSAIEVTRENRLKLALESIKAGAGLERVCGSLSFSEFEDFGAEALRANGFETFTRFVFRYADRKYEMDLIGRRDSTTICVDCKHWRYGLFNSRLLNAVKKQISRTEALVKELGRYGETLAIPPDRKTIFVPVIVTLAESQTSMIEGVPLVPVLKLGSFLSEFDLYLDDLLLIQPS
jgi:Holliday junction resolvase-like predicted endonuclease